MGTQPALSARHVLTAVLLAVSAIALLGTTADPDLWGHVRFGQDILAAGELPRSDTYSFTSDRPWINHEWLAETAMALAFQSGRASGLNLLRLVVIGLTLFVVWAHLKDVEPVLRLQLVAAAGAGILLRVHPFRPQIFSILLFAVLLWVIGRAERRDSMAPLVAVPLIMIPWVNLHGGWIVGIGVFGFWASATATIGQTLRGRVVVLGLLLAAASAATLINPYGIGMWSFLAETVRVERPNIADWEPLLSLPPAFAALWLVPAVVAVAVIVSARNRVATTHAALVVLLGIAALRVSRLDAFFALAVVFFLGPLLSRKPGEESEGTSSRARSWSLALTAALLVVVSVGAWQLPRIKVSPGSPEPEAARYIRDNRLEGRMLTWFDWGEYAIWHLSPAIRVSIDGRRETVYTDDVTAKHLAFYSGAEGSQGYPDVIGADFVWLPRELPAVQKLLASGWRPAFEGPVSVVLTRSQTPPTVRSSSPSGLRMFPSM